jgi:two-component system sensor histidine kinase/response regulator
MYEIIPGSYNLHLVTLSFTIAVIASYTALDLAGRVTPASSARSRLMWVIGGAVAMGTGIWSMHFIAMLAFQLPIPVTYNVTTTLLSLLDAIVASGVALLLFSRPQLNLGVFFGGSIVMGLAIASMHYLGMAAVQVPATMHYDPWLVTLSVAIAIGASGAALWLAFQFRNPSQLGMNWPKLLSAGVMGIAISGMHYTGMWATCFMREPAIPRHITTGSDNTWLATQVGICTLIFLWGTLLTSQLDRQYAAQLVRQTALEESEKRFRSLIREMPVGVLLLDLAGTVLWSNRMARVWFNFSETDLAGQTIHRHLLNEAGEPFAPADHPIEQVLQHRQPIHNQVVGLQINQQNLWLILNIDPQLGEDGNLERLICTFSNITERRQAEVALLQSETRFALAVEGASVGIWDWDLQNNHIYFSPRCKTILGYEDAELLNTLETWQNTIHPDDLDHTTTVLNDYLENRIPTYEVEFRARHQDGSYRWIFARGAALRDETGRPYRLSGSHTDITQRKQTEQALQRSNIRYKNLATNIPGMIYQFRLSANGEKAFTYVSPACQILYGIDPHKVQQDATQLLEIIHPDDRKQVERSILISGKTLKPWHCVWRVVVQGKMKWLQGDAQPYQDTDGSIIWDGLVVEITERKHTEIALQESAQREKAIAQVIQRMRQTLDLDTIFRATTQELRQVLKCDRVAIYQFYPDWSGDFVAESVGYGWRRLVEGIECEVDLTAGFVDNERCIIKRLSTNQTHSPVIDTHLQETQGGIYVRGTPYRVVEDIYQAGFNECYVALLEEFQAKAYIIVPIFCGSQLWGLLASYQNASPRQWSDAEINVTLQIGTQFGVALQQAELLAKTQQQSEALQQAAFAADAANRAKSEFLAKMSHELRTPLNAILGFAQVMNHDLLLSAEHRQHLNIINRAGEHLLDLINDILEMSKIEAGQMTLNETTFDLYGLLNTLKELLSFKAQAKGLQLILECRPDVPQYIQSDEGKLRQVLMNLLSNAIKFTEKGQVTLQVQRLTEKSLFFTIEDTGAGIAPEEISLLFKPFGQTETGRKSGQGTGLGLAISQKFVQMMGGNIHVKTQVGCGSLFEFELPVQFSDAVPQILSPGRVIGLASHQPEYRILVVEDVRVNRLLLVKLFKNLGFCVREAENGEAAIEMWESWQPHLIWMDMQMPVIDGYEATQHIKARQQQQATITTDLYGAGVGVANAIKSPEMNHKTVIIAITASAFDEDRQAVLAAGCDDFVSKPFREEILLAKMQEHLGVQYIYEAVEHKQQQINFSVESTLEQPLEIYLNQMPQDWIKRVYQAADECSDDLIFQLVQEIPLQAAPLAEALTNLASYFLFDDIMELIKLAESNIEQNV